MKKSIALLCVVVCAISGLELPPEMKKCKRNEPDMNACLKSAMQAAFPVLLKGLPDFKLDSIEPIKVPSLSIGEGTGAVHVVQNYKNVEIHNIHSIVIESVESSVSDDQFVIQSEGFIKECGFKADYEINGNILVMPVTGSGKCTIDLENTKVSMKMVGEKFSKKDHDYFEIKQFEVSLDPKMVKFDFQNLFNGDARLGDEMNKLLNDNWNEIFTDVKGGYEEALGAIFMGIANVIFKKVPFDEMFPL
ncbi:hypothetical protein FQA39_LY16866 [Lamprigera yunnana]|nr:hypothetical protein FQA39_LY16866 [Lamprigera yunnana]